jgi:amidase
MIEERTETYAGATAGGLAKALAAREVSALELCDQAIKTIEAKDGPINGVVVRDFQRARETARVADARLARGDREPLLGVPMTVKEAINVAGLPTTWGVHQFKGWTAPEDAVSIKRLRAAGAVILGKTNVPPWLGDWQASNSIYGRTNNPWDLTRTPGGSSGGSAAAVAAGMTPLELGSDLAGSLRVPAAFCGVYAHKPSYGVVPQRGFAPPGVSGAAVPLTVLGPMARTAADLELALGVLAGPDDDDAVGYRLQLPPPRHASLADHRALILDHHPGAALDDEIKGALHRLGDRLESRGVKVARVTDLLPDLAAGLELFGDMVRVVTSRGGPSQAKPLSAHAWMDLLDRQLAFRRSWNALFNAFDVVMAPAFGAAAFPHQDDPDIARRTVMVNGRPTPYLLPSPWVAMAAVAHFPATTAPIDQTSDGLPIGIQIIGPYLEDRTTIAFAGLLERELGGFRAPRIP